VTTRGCSLVVLEVQWSVRDRGSYGWVPEDCHPRCYSMSLVVLGQIQTMIRIWEVHLVLRIVAVTRLFPRVDYRWWPVVGRASRHLWQQGSINVIIKGCRIKRHRKEDENVWVWDWRVSRVLGVLIYYYNVLYDVYFFFSSPYMCVFDDDHVTRYMGADVDACEHVDT